MRVCRAQSRRGVGQLGCMHAGWMTAKMQQFKKGRLPLPSLVVHSILKKGGNRLSKVFILLLKAASSSGESEGRAITC